MTSKSSPSVGTGAALHLQSIDQALLRLRRLWVLSTSPEGRETDVGEGVPLSTALVVDAVQTIGGEPSVADVARAIQVDPSTASRLVRRAVDGRFVSGVRSATDARRIVLQLTPSGRDLYLRSRDYRCGYLSEVTRDWPTADRAAFARLLGRFADAVAERPPGGAS